MLNNIITDILKNNIAIIFKLIFSLNISKPNNVVNKVVDIFCNGKNTALFISPASVVLKRFAPPKQRPVSIGAVKFFKEGLLFSTLNKYAAIETAKANTNPISKNALFSLCVLDIP